MSINIKQEKARGCHNSVHTVNSLQNKELFCAPKEHATRRHTNRNWIILRQHSQSSSDCLRGKSSSRSCFKLSLNLGEGKFQVLSAPVTRFIITGRIKAHPCHMLLNHPADGYCEHSRTRSQGFGALFLHWPQALEAVSCGLYFRKLAASQRPGTKKEYGSFCALNSLK